jgi:hypothetical protein
MIFDLFHGDTFGQVSWLIHIQTFKISHIVGQELKGNGKEDRGQ